MQYFLLLQFIWEIFAMISQLMKDIQENIKHSLNINHIPVKEGIKKVQYSLNYQILRICYIEKDRNMNMILPLNV